LRDEERGETRLRRGDEDGDEETIREGNRYGEEEVEIEEAAQLWGLGLGRGTGLEAGLA